jgi:guanylate kinase
VPLLLVDPNEAIDIQQHHPDSLVIFLKPVSLTVIKRRLTARGGPLDEIDERLRLAKEALSSAPVFAYCITNKDGQLEETIRLVKKTIRAYLGL